MEKGFCARENVRLARRRRAARDSSVLPLRETAPPMVIVAGSCQLISGPAVVLPVAKASERIVRALNWGPLSRKLRVMSCLEAVPVPRPVSGSVEPERVLLPKKPSSVSVNVWREREKEPAALSCQSPRRHSESTAWVKVSFLPLRQASRKS